MILLLLPIGIQSIFGGIVELPRFDFVIVCSPGISFPANISSPASGVASTLWTHTERGELRCKRKHNTAVVSELKYLTLTLAPQRHQAHDPSHRPLEPAGLHPGGPLGSKPSREVSAGPLITSDRRRPAEQTRLEDYRWGFLTKSKGPGAPHAQRGVKHSRLLFPDCFSRFVFSTHTQKPILRVKCAAHKRAATRCHWESNMHSWHKVVIWLFLIKCVVIKD